MLDRFAVEGRCLIWRRVTFLTCAVRAVSFPFTPFQEGLAGCQRGLCGAPCDGPFRVRVPPLACCLPLTLSRVFVRSRLPLRGGGSSPFRQVCEIQVLCPRSSTDGAGELKRVAPTSCHYHCWHRSPSCVGLGCH